jgi:hypothetical protein
MSYLSRHVSRRFRIILVACLALGTVALALPAASAHAQQAFRTVNGLVSDKGGAPIKGAVVHLKDTKSLAMRSYITADDGQYKFAQLSTNVDYEVWADSSGKKSDSKSISSFDNKSAATVNLKVQ